MSALITRASISSVTPGRVAIRAPASLAALRAAVWESDCTVGARTTSAAAIAAANAAGGSPAWDAALGHHRQDRLRPGRGSLVAQRHADPLGRLVADHEHLLAFAHPEAVANHGPRRSIQALAHRAQA